GVPLKNIKILYFSFQRILRVTTFFIAFWIILVSNYPEDLALFIFPSYHGSSFIFGLIFYRIIFQIDNINKIIAFILLSGLVISSDTQIVYTFYIPFLLTSIFLKSALPEKLYIKVFIYFVVSFVVGSFFLKLLGSINIFSVPSIPVWKEIKMNIFQLKILENIRNITPVVKVYFMELYSDKILFFYLLIVSVPLNLYYAFKKTEVKTELRFFSLYVLLVLFVSIFTQMFFGIWGGARYVWAIYFFPYVSILIYFGNSLSRMLTNGNYRKVEGMRKYVFLLSKDRIRSQLILFGIVIIFLVLFIFMYLIKGRVELTVSQPYPPFVSCLDELKKKYDLTYGISDYWNAKHVSYLSKEKLFVNQVFVNLEKYNWINNRDWYKRDKENQSIHYHFILPERLDINRIKEKFGSDYKTEICEGREVFVFEKGFYY
ncbi:MAG TPA: hypothetical protein PLS71_24685, partial [Leptospiraceae bacterium]|nr:hypothetical protein [Leptospiraceae bacterium]